jgi:hypothetical protein
MTFPIFNSHACDWRGLSQDLLAAISTLEALNREAPSGTISRSILFSISPELQDIRIEYCDPAGQQLGALGQSLSIHFAALPVSTDVERDDGSTAPNASIDRAISTVAAEMLSWSKDPETCELIEHQRYQLYLRWSGRDAAKVYEWAYGLWDA